MGTGHQQWPGQAHKQEGGDQRQWAGASGVGWWKHSLSFAAKEYTLNLGPGQTQNINLGWPIDTSQNKYEFTMIVKVKDFVDPNSGNNGYKETLDAMKGPGPQPQPQPQPQPGGKGIDLAVTDLYPQNQPKGKIWARITNHGPDSVSGTAVETTCTATVHG